MLRQPALLTRRRVKFTLLSPNPKFRWRWVASPELSKTPRDMGAQNGSLQTGSLRINNDINLETV